MFASRLLMVVVLVAVTLVVVFSEALRAALPKSVTD